MTRAAAFPTSLTLLLKKCVKIYPNEKPWVTKEVKKLLKAKQYAFQTGDNIALKIAQAELKANLRKSKEAYKNKIQAQFKQNNTKQAWHSVKLLLGCNKSKKRCSVSNSAEFANDLNTASTVMTLKSKGTVLSNTLIYYHSTRSTYQEMM